MASVSPHHPGPNTESGLVHWPLATWYLVSFHLSTIYSLVYGHDLPVMEFLPNGE